MFSSEKLFLLSLVWAIIFVIISNDNIVSSLLQLATVYCGCVHVMLIDLTHNLAIGLRNSWPKRLFTSTRAAFVMEDIEEVEIDGQGKFKYIQIIVKDNQGREKLIVRGHRTSYHANILDSFQKQYPHLQSSSPGGGRIDHKPDKKSIFVYGYSMVN